MDEQSGKAQTSFGKTIPVDEKESALDALAKPRRSEIAEMKLINPELGRNESLSLSTLITGLKTDVKKSYDYSETQSNRTRGDRENALNDLIEKILKESKRYLAAKEIQAKLECEVGKGVIINITEAHIHYRQNGEVKRAKISGLGRRISDIKTSRKITYK